MKNLFKMCLSMAIGVILTAPAFAYPDVTPTHWAFKQIQELTEGRYCRLS